MLNATDVEMAQIYRPAIEAAGFAATYTTHSLICWAMTLSVDSWKNCEAGHDDHGEIYYWSEMEVLRRAFEHLQDRAMQSSELTWALRRWQPEWEEWACVIVAIHALHGLELAASHSRPWHDYERHFSDHS